MAKAAELLHDLKQPGATEAFHRLYGAREGMLVSQLDRYVRIVKKHMELFPTADDVRFFSAPGRTEIGGNHTDHNAGCVLAAAINLDTVAAVSKNGANAIHLHSEGYRPVVVDLADLAIKSEENASTAALARGVAARMKEKGYEIGGFDAVVTSNVLSGSGLSSSAAVEVLIAAIMDGLYGGAKMDPRERAKIAQYAENVYFGKPSGLMDQMASSVGGLVNIDFRHAEAVVKPLSFDFAANGYAVIVVSTGGSHGDLTDDYASIRKEMVQVAEFFGDKVLRGVRPEQVENGIAALREHVSDRAILRALHFFDDNQRVSDEVDALKKGDIQRFFELIIESGESSWMLLQNVWANPKEQSMALALEMAHRLLQGKGAWRVHGGGFAGTILCFVPNDMVKLFVKKMNAVFGDHACATLDIRQSGACEVTIRK